MEYIAAKDSRFAGKDRCFLMFWNILQILIKIIREQRVSQTRPIIVKNFAEKQKEFLDFVLDSYVKTGVEELEERKIPTLLELKYGSVSDAQQKLGNIEEIRKTFISFQKYLYSEKIA